MSWRKNGFGYALWVLYLLAAGLGAVCLGIHTGVTYGLELYASALSAGAFLVFLILLFFGVRRLAVPRLKGGGNGWKRSLAEAGAVVLLLAAGLVLRILWLGYAGENAAYYDAARIMEGASIPMVAHGAEYLYLQLLHVLFLLLGNKWMAGIWLQIALQLLAGLLLYLGVRKLAGALAGAVMLAFWTLSPPMILEGLTYSPDMLYLCVYGAGLISVACFLEKRAGERKWTVYDGLLLIFTGVVISFVIYLDVTGLTLLLPAASVLWLNKPARRNIWESGPLELGLLFLGAAGGFAGCLALDAYASGKAFGSVLRTWRELFAVKAYDERFWQSGGEPWVYAALFALLALGILSFWCRKGAEKFSPWVLLLPALCGVSFCHMTAPGMDADLLLFWVCTVLAGISVSECFCRGKAAAGAGEDAAEEAELQEMPEKQEKPGEQEKPVMRRKVQKPGEQEKAEVRKEAERPGEQEKTEVRKEAERPEKQEKPQAAPREVKLIENPLPLPKKHVKKTMDYKYIPDTDQLDFDLDVSEDDDFDL